MIAKFIKSKKWITLAVFSLALAGFAIVSLTETSPISEIEIEKLGGKITRQFVYFGAVTYVDLSDTDVTDEHLVHLKDLTRLELLWLSNTQITDAGLAHLKHLTQLTQLNLAQTQITDAVLFISKV